MASSAGNGTGRVVKVMERAQDKREREREHLCRRRVVGVRVGEGGLESERQRGSGRGAVRGGGSYVEREDAREELQRASGKGIERARGARGEEGKRERRRKEK